MAPPGAAPDDSGLLVRDCTAIPIAPPGEVLEHQDLLVRGRHIVALGPTRSLDDQVPAGAPTLDGRGRVLLPGLVNAHTHTALTAFRATTEAVTLEPWLAWLIPRQRRLDPAAVHASALLACAEQIKAGITTFADMLFVEEHAAPAIAASGLRAVVSRTIMGADPLGADPLGADPRGAGSGLDPTAAVAGAVEFTEQWHGAANGRVTCRLAPHSVYGCLPSVLRATADAAARLGVGIQTHCSETRTEVAGCLEQHGVTPPRLLSETGCLDRPLLLAHAVHLTDEDIELLDRPGVGLSHNPGSNLKLQSGRARLPELVGRRLAVGLGTDSAASNDTLDLWKELYLAAVLHPWPEGSSPAWEVLALATIGGARALGLEDEIGSLVPGKRADFILVDTRDLRYAPGNDLARSLVYAGRATDVVSTVVDGAVLMDERRLVHLDEASIAAECRARAQAALG